MEETTPTTKEERTWAMAAHLSAIVGHFIPFGNIIAPLIIWVVKKDEMPLVNDQAKEALNFQISLSLYLLVAAVLMFVLIGFLVFPVVWLVGLVLIIVASIKAYEGVRYRYPLTIRLVK